jgi:diaminopimelate decarboxylase
VFCRVLTDGAGAEWPLSRKFGCVPAMAVDVLRHARTLGLDAYGVSFHVGSQQTDLNAWDRALADAKRVFATLAEEGIVLKMVNMGGGFPTRYLRDVPAAQAYGQAIFSALRKHFGNNIPETIIEPGRGMVGNAGVIKSEVVLISRKSDNDNVRWVYLDIGKFGGLAETMDEAIRYPIVTAHDGGEVAPCVLAGPTCDSADVMYEREPYALPVSLEGAYLGKFLAGWSFLGFSLLLTWPVGIGMGLGNALAPISVKEHFESRPVYNNPPNRQVAAGVDVRDVRLAVPVARHVARIVDEDTCVLAAETVTVGQGADAEDHV